jgi:hypothetical protein
MPSFQTFDHSYRKALKNDHPGPSAVKYAAKKYVSQLLDTFDLEYVTKGTEVDITDDFVNDYIDLREKGKAHEKAFTSASAHLKDVINSIEKAEKRQRERGNRVGRERMKPYSENIDDFIEHVKRGVDGMHVHDTTPRYHEQRHHTERAYTARYVPQNSPAPPMPAGRGRYEFPEPVYASPRKEFFSEKSYFPDMASPEEFFRKISRSGGYGWKAPAGTGAQDYNTQEFRPSVTGRWKDTREYEEFGMRGTWREENGSSGERERYESREDRPRYKPYKTKEYVPREDRPRYKSHKPSPPPVSPSLTLNLYDILGVSCTATQAEIKTAYRKLSLKHHPDRCEEKDEATGKMAEINMANDVLSDEWKRRAYNLTGRV